MLSTAQAAGSARVLADLERYLAEMRDIPGWLDGLDAELLCALSAAQRATESQAGRDVLEIGVYKGRSAVLLGFLLGPGERLIACDTFLDSAGISAQNADWNRRFYPGLTRAEFERNYLRYHDELPLIVAEPSTRLPGLLPPASCRLVHVDGGHEHATVTRDALAVRRLLAPGGAVIFDDYCKPHLPGTALAVWEQVLLHGLVVIALTDAKLYAAWDAGAAASYRDALVAAARARPGTRIDEHWLGGRAGHAPGSGAVDRA
jgi:SAM-dependent methyltransferase